MSGLSRCAVIGVIPAVLAACSPGGDSTTARSAAHAPAQGARRLAVVMSPGQGFAAAPPANAEALNAARPFDAVAIDPMRPFVLKASAADRERAVQCLAQAVYYEAAREPLSGQQAVAQVVLNRVRHPAYPKSICGVVYQGASRPTGCQFTFTCDGSLRWRPEPALWERAVQVARLALAGYVDKDVGSATHYHAAYVAPYWAPTLVKMTQVGQHIFYRWTGAWGEPAAFVGRYRGREAELTPQILTGGEPLAPPEAAPLQRTVTLNVGGGLRTYKVADTAAPRGRPQAAGVLRPTQRQATPEQIRQINASLANLEKQLDAADAKTVASAAASSFGASS